MFKNFVRENVTLVSIILFLFIFASIHIMKPACFYNKDGSIRHFGIGYKNKTILPIWLSSVVLGILSYLFVLFYISSNKFINLKGF
jgi:hypothetical protein